jgi:hypothetical protein
MRTTDLAFAGLYLLVLAIAASQISHLSDTSSTIVSTKLYPWVVLGTGLLMGGLEALRTVLAGSQPDDPTFGAVWAGAFSRRRTLLLVLFVLYLAAITSFGFIASTAVFCFASIVILSPARSLRETIMAAVIAAAVIGLIYVLLVVYLQAFLP